MHASPGRVSNVTKVVGPGPGWLRLKCLVLGFRPRRLVLSFGGNMVRGIVFGTLFQAVAIAFVLVACAMVVACTQ
jgi:hypothetical protein